MSGRSYPSPAGVRRGYPTYFEELLVKILGTNCLEISYRRTRIAISEFLEYKNGGKTNISIDEKEKLKVWPELPKYTLSLFTILRQ